MVLYWVLVINCGEVEKVLKVSIDVDCVGIDWYCYFCFIGQYYGLVIELVEVVYQDVYKCFIGLVIECEFCNELSVVVNEQVIKVFGDNLYYLLMQVLLKGCVVLGFDFVYWMGCKLVVMDVNGKFLDKFVIYLYKLVLIVKWEVVVGEFKVFLEKYYVEMIVIGNGMVFCEFEEFVVQVLKIMI